MKFPSLVAIAGLLVMAVATSAVADDWLSLYGAARGDARRLSGSALAEPLGPVQWQETEDERREQWREMLGLSPLPERTPMQATVTGTLDRGDYVVEKIHFQSSPGAYVAGNLYRPAKVEGPLPAVLYLCGHSTGKVNPPYQQNARWFGQHGYIALILDPIQVGESQGLHHGTYREGRWDWPSRGYTPAGTEVWNAMRALDYLETRDDVDPERFGVTGLSGGGVISWCLAAADKRIRCVAPVCQSGSIEQAVVDQSVQGHCDCAFWINYYRWDWSNLGALIAPRPLLIASGSEDVLWRPSGYLHVAERIRRQYGTLDAVENFQVVEDLSRHGYTPKLRLAVFSWFDKHLKGDDTPATEDITDYVEPARNLLVFDGQLPEDDTMSEIDKTLVVRSRLPELTDKASWEKHQQEALERLRATTFRNTVQPPRYSDFRTAGRDRSEGQYGTHEFAHADGIKLSVKTRRDVRAQAANPTLVFAVPSSVDKTFAGGGTARPRMGNQVTTAAVLVRNSGPTSVGEGYLWTVRRTLPLLGHTLPERQVSDLLSGVAVMRRQPTTGPISLYGEGDAAVLAIYAALLDPEVEQIVIADPPTTHEDPATPEFLGVLRVGDLPHNLALLFPRPITFVGEVPQEFQWTRKVYQRFGAGDRFRVVDRPRDWQPQ